ncbi:DUF1275 family protein [Pseudomonas sp. dw_358]|uniref:DUF1275 family protein n=1 Tax=Pseudomonas sp. dw_358 TaxID=2720083 RepID=UPI001BD214D6|nr:DUF1275 family protein [Pseudomonas sp. dw_358]
MPDPRPSPIILGVIPLVLIAGATDALMILHSKELLAVYMTGDTSKVGHFLLDRQWPMVGSLLAVIGTFLVATTVAAWMGQRAGEWRGTLVLAMSGLLLALAAPLAALDQSTYSLATVMVIAAAIGSLNQARADEPGVSFVTGVLVKAGRKLASGEFKAAGSGLLRWLALLLGALIGTWLDGRFGSATLLIIAAFIALNALCALPRRATALI